MVTAETGASTDASGMEPTKHQKQVMSGDKSDKAGAETAVTDETTASTSGQVKAEISAPEGGDWPGRFQSTRSDDEGSERDGEVR